MKTTSINRIVDNSKTQAKQHTLIDSVMKGEIGIPRLMAIPSNIDPDTVVCENKWMSDEVKVNRAALVKGWNDVYRILSIESPVFVMSDNPNTEVPSNDLVWAANSGLALKGADGKHKFIVSRFKAKSRRTETPVIAEFVKNIFGEENVIIPPEEYNGKPLFFEGEADCKAIGFDKEKERTNVYVVGVGVRTNEVFCEWFQDNFDVKAIPYKAPDDIIEDLYHLDCLLFPVDKYSIIMNTYGIDKETIKEIKKHTEIIEMGEDEVDVLFNGLTNSIRGKHSIIMPFSPDYIDDQMDEDELDEYVSLEFDKLEIMDEIADEAGLQLITVDSSAGYALGAQTSCLSCLLCDQYYLYHD